MLEVKKGIKLRGNVASVIATLEKRQNNNAKNYKITKMKEITAKEDSKEKEENKENIKVLDKESESDSEKEHVYELEEINNTQLNTIREERETASEASNNKTSKGAEDSNSSPEESTIKHTWSGSGSPAVLSSGSDFSSSDDEENGGENKRNSMTKDCNSDFHWVVSDKQAETKSLFDKKEEPKKYSNFYDDLKIEENKKTGGDSNPFFSMDRNRKMIFEFSDPKADNLVQLRLPPQSPGSLDRKKISKSRSERDSKCKSSVITRPIRKSPAKVLPEDYSFQFSRIHDYCQEDAEHKYCSHYRGKYPDCSCHSPHYDYHQHHYHQHQHRCYSPCRNYYGSCESIGDKSSRKNSFGSQKNLMKICDVYDDRRSPRKSNWQNSQTKLYQGSNECLCHNRCCQLDREKSQSWRLLGKSVPELEDRIIRLENDKESLQLQVTVLTEQVEAQSEKISDLQHSLEDKKQQLNNADDLLQREMLTRSSLETQKLELMSAISELKLQHAALERENYELKEEKKRYQSIKPPMMPRNTSPALLQNTPLGVNRYSPNDYGTRKSGNPFSNQDIYHSDPSSQSNPFADSHRYIPSSTPNNNVNNVIGSPSPSPVITLSQRREDLKYVSMTPQPNIRRGMDQYNSLPRQKLIESDQLSHLADVHRKGVAFGKGKTSLITLKSEKSYSAPNLAETERLSVRSDQGENRTETDFSAPIELAQTHGSSKKGIKKIFNKIKRSNSGNVNDLLGDGEFRRGGIRATAGPRLGGPIIHIHITPDKSFPEWETEHVCNWLEDIGLENYVADLRRWIKNGSQLLGASFHDLEKELGMKNPLHKKKLMLALQEISDKNQGADELLKPAGCLDTHWVLRWLDDVGLPQHKEVFLTARIDGRMLHRLTMDDLSVLHITSQLHVASLKRGIKVLRDNKWDPNCLIRRSVADEPPPTVSDVTLWTNHRVMEWLRIVDLAEYAPNLRGSGVHGALMVYEPKFTAELLASLLSIPPNKTLLRRHLSTHFKELLGREIIQAKREAESTLGYIPLTPSAKVKTIKKPQFTLKRKKSKNEFDYGDLVCPLEEGTSGEQSTPSNNSMGVNGDGMMKEKRHVPDVCPVTDPSPRDSPLTDRLSRV